MFNETVNTKTQELSKGGFSLNEGSELFNRKFVGEYVDTIYHADGRVEVLEGHNTIINNIGKLIACLFKGQNGYGRLGYWAIGSGSSSWDNVNPPTASVEDTGCVNEIGRKAINASDIKFIDSNNAETSSITNRIQITVTFTENECNGTWREFSIFGGNATATANSGIAINHKNHAIMVKTNTMVVERQIRFTFN